MSENKTKIQRLRVCEKDNPRSAGAREIDDGAACVNEKKKHAAKGEEDSLVKEKGWAAGWAVS